MARILLGMLAVLLMLGSIHSAGAVSKRTKQRQLTDTQVLFSKAMRWGDFDQALRLVDPTSRQVLELTNLERSRYKQVEITGYNEVGSRIEPGDVVVRTIEMRIVNRNTMTERTMRVDERWRWDSASERWLLQGGLPKLWSDQ